MLHLPLLIKFFGKSCARRHLNYDSLTFTVASLQGHTTSKGLYFCRPSYPALQESHVRQPRCCCPTCPTLHPCAPFLTTVLSMLQHFSQGKSLKKKGFIAHAPTNTSAKCNLKRIIIQGIIVPLPNTSYMMRSIYPANAATRIK